MVTYVCCAYCAVGAESVVTAVVYLLAHYTALSLSPFPFHLTTRSSPADGVY